VIAVDVTDEKLALAKRLGADMTINAATQDAVKGVQAAIRGAHGVLVTAVSRAAFGQALGMLHKRGTMSLVGRPPGSFDLPIFDIVLNAKTVRGSIVGTRKDLEEALVFAGRPTAPWRLSGGVEPAKAAPGADPGEAAHGAFGRCRRIAMPWSWKRP
jgi:propanol-preferring alcohol dehydrogenase